MSTDLESRLRALPDRLAGLHAPDDLAAVVRARHRQHRRRRLMAAVVAVAAVLAGTTAVVDRVRDGTPTPPAAPLRGPMPTDPRLLHWPTRGPLAGDAEAVRTALLTAAQTYRDTGDPTLRAGPPHLLWIGPAGDGTHTLEGLDRFAVTQRYVTGEQPGLYLQWLSGSATNRWHLRASFMVVPENAATSLLWSFGPPCLPDRGTCDDQYVRLLVLGAPDVDTVRYQFPGAPAKQAAVTDGFALATERVDAEDADSSGEISANVVVTRRGGHPESVPTGMPARVKFAVRPPPAVEWAPARGLPPVLDAPETFPGLDLWGRLHGLPGRPGYGNPVWGGTLADGSRAVIAQPMTGDGRPDHLVFAVNPPPVADTKDTFLVRDLPNPADPKAVMQVSAYLPLSDGRCELVVVGKPGTTAVRYAEDGRTFTDLAVRDGVGSRVLASCDGHAQARISVRRGSKEAYAGPVDSTQPGAGVKRG